MTGRHPDPYDMVAYARGHLHSGAADELLEHCESCSECGNQLAAVLLLRQSRGGRAGISGRRWIAAAAAAVLAIGLGVGGYWVSRVPTPADGIDPSRPSATMTVPEGRAEDSGGASGFSDLVTPELPDWALGSHELALSYYRAVPADSGDHSTIPVLREALAAIKEARYPRAVEMLSACCGEGRFDKWGTMLLGMALYAQDEDRERAASVFEEVAERDPDEEGQNARWFLANVRLLQGRPESALEVLRQIHPDTVAASKARELIPRVEERLRSR